VSPGDRYGRLVLIERGPVAISSQLKRRTWIAQCDCGARTRVLANSLGRHSRSCGCLRIEIARTKARLPDGRFVCG
jgi:hypothetical protein